MNRRSFISLLAGGAGTTLVPWRGLVEPRIFLPPTDISFESLIERYARAWVKTVDNVNRTINDFQVYDSIMTDLRANHVSVDPRTGQLSLGSYIGLLKA